MFGLGQLGVWPGLCTRKGRPCVGVTEYGLDLVGLVAISSNSYDLGTMQVFDGIFHAHEHRGSLGERAFGSSAETNRGWLPRRLGMVDSDVTGF